MGSVAKTMPPARAKRIKYDWDSLVAVGDCFFVADDDQRARQTKICSAASQHGERVGRAYRTEVGEHEGAKGVFVWLTTIS